jgi:acetyl-CoA C-acetyltransferase
MTSAVIVSTARTPLAKSWKGAFNMTHGATLGGHAVKHAVERAGIDGAEVDDVIMGCANPEGATGANIARQIALRAGCPSPPAGDRQPLLLVSGLQTIALAAQRIIAGEADIYVAGGVESISCVQQEMNTHMMADPWLLAKQARDLLEHAADRRAGGQALQHRPRAMDEYGAASQQKATAALEKAACSRTRSPPSP